MSDQNPHNPWTLKFGDVNYPGEGSSRVTLRVPPPSSPSPPPPPPPPPLPPQRYWNHDLCMEYDVKKNHDRDKFQGSMKLREGDRQLKGKDVLILGFQDINSAPFLGSDHFFNPVFQFAYHSTSNVTRRMIAVGEDKGQPLFQFLGSSSAHYWEYNNQDVYLRAGKNFRRIGRLIASAIYSLHLDKGYVGGELLRSVFVKDVDNTLSISFVGSQEYGSRVDGMWADLKDLQYLVGWVQSHKRVRDRHNNISQSGEDLFDLWMFEALFEREKPNEVEDLLVFSYYVCHAPIFWEFEQRYSFCYTFYQIRNIYNPGFDSDMDFGSFYQMDDDWAARVYDASLQIVLRYTPKNCSYQNKDGLLPFHRNAYLHSQDKPSSVDKKLLQMFPYAIPIAWTQLYVKFPKLREDFRKYFCRGPAGLDYSKLVEDL